MPAIVVHGIATDRDGIAGHELPNRRSLGRQAAVVKEGPPFVLAASSAAVLPGHTVEPQQQQHPGNQGQPQPQPPKSSTLFLEQPDSPQRRHSHGSRPLPSEAIVPSASSGRITLSHSNNNVAAVCRCSPPSKRGGQSLRADVRGPRDSLFPPMLGAAGRSTSLPALVRPVSPLRLRRGLSESLVVQARASVVVSAPHCSGLPEGVSAGRY